MTSTTSLLRRYAFTISICAVLVAVGIATETHVATISHRVLMRWGWAPRDMWHDRFGTLVTSLVITNGGIVFWEALGMTALLCGLAEHRLGTARAAAAFIGIHLAVSFAMAGGIAIHNAVYDDLWRIARDVGPSAGYYGCLGVWLGVDRSRWKSAGAIAVLASLVVALFLPAHPPDTPATKLAAESAHLMAFPMGWLAGLAMRRWDRAAIEPADSITADTDRGGSISRSTGHERSE